MIDLYHVLAPCYKQKQVVLPLQYEIWKAVKPKEKFNQLKFARLHSDFLKKLEEFVVVDELKQNDAQKLENLLRYYNQNNLTRLYPDAAQQARKKLELSPHRHGDYYLQLYRLEALQNSFLELQNQRSTEKNLQQTIEALDVFYLINKLNYLAAILHYKKFLAIEEDVKLAAEIMAHLRKTDYKHIPALDMQYRVVLTLTEPEQEENFYELRALLVKQHTILPKQQARGLYAFAINYCIRKINFGALNYVNELLSIYKQMLKAELMTDDEGTLSQFDYKNIVTVALRAGDALWAEKFITDYKNRIAKTDRQNAYTFNLARLHFYQRRFDKVLPLLQDVVYSDIFYQLDSKTTLMKTYYELGEYMPLMALKESFRILLRRKKVISEQNRINYMNFLRYTMKLYRIDVKDTQKLQSLKKQITTSTNIADKTWLMEKVNELSA